MEQRADLCYKFEIFSIPISKNNFPISNCTISQHRLPRPKKIFQQKTVENLRTTTINPKLSHRASRPWCGSDSVHQPCFLRAAQTVGKSLINFYPTICHKNARQIYTKYDVFRTSILLDFPTFC